MKASYHYDRFFLLIFSEEWEPEKHTFNPQASHTGPLLLKHSDTRACPAVDGSPWDLPSLEIQSTRANNIYETLALLCSSEEDKRGSGICRLPPPEALHLLHGPMCKEKTIRLMERLSNGLAANSGEMGQSHEREEP